MEKAEQSNNGNARVMEYLLNAIDSNLYVSDIDTDEILFINDRMKREYAITGDVVGRKCWEVLQDGQTGRCEFCPVYELVKNMDAPVVWEEHNTITRKYYRNTDTIIEWRDGKKVHFQDSVDITELKAAEAILNRRIEEQKLMSGIAQILAGAGSIELLMKKAFEAIADFMDINAAAVARDIPEENKFVIAVSHGDITHGMEVSYEGKGRAYERLKTSEIITEGDSSRVPDEDFIGVQKIGKVRRIVTPLIVNRNFWGYLVMSSLDLSAEWSESDRHLTKLIGSIFSVALERDESARRRFAAEQRLQTVIDNLPLAIYWKGTDSVYQGCNKHFAGISGIPAEEIAGKTDYDFLDEESAATNREEDKRILQTGETMDKEQRELHDADRWVHSVKSPIWDENGLPAGIVGIFEDITEKKETERRLVQMSAVVDNSPQFICYIKRNGQVEFYNPATLKITGYTREELFNGGIYMLYGNEGIRRIKEELLPEVFEKGEIVFEIPLTRKDGDKRYMEISAFKVKVDDEYSCAAIATDITQRKILQEEIEKEKEAAEKANRAKSEFLSRMSHEIRTPMNAIIGMTKIASSSNDPGKKEYCLEKIDGASKHLLGLLNDILDMSKIEASKLELSQEEFNFEKMLMDALNIANFLVAEKEQELVVEAGRDLPAFIVGDEMRLKQVITNLLSNAVKFTDRKGTIKFKAEKVGGEEDSSDILIEVEDNGIGISEDQKDRIWNAFEQAEGNTTRKYGGTGLGLPISRRIINLMGSDIQLESEVGVGSKFSFTINVKHGEQSVIENISEHVDKDDLKILVVDDAKDTREYCALVIKGFGIEICDVAEDGFAALSMIEEREKAGDQYGIIFVDWKMPRMDGVELARRIREIVKDNTIVIMISVAEWSEVEKEARAAGVSKFISKPLFPSTLMDVINEVKGVPEKRLAARDDGAGYNFSGCTVLLAEDIEINREIIYALLEDTGIALEYAETGVQALEKFKEDMGKYDAILMDLHMPEMNGYEAAQAIRAIDDSRARDIPIIAMTASAFKEDVEKCRQAGMNHHIPKPVEPEELFTVLSDYLKPKDISEPAPLARAEESIEISGSYELADVNDEELADYMPVIDVEEGLERVLGKKKLYISLLKSCKVEDAYGNLKQTIDTRDAKACLEAAHYIKGMAANLSLSALWKITCELEFDLKNDLPAERTMRLYEKIVNATMRAISGLTAKEG